MNLDVRIKILRIAVFIAICAALLRIGYWQLWQGGKMASLANDQQLSVIYLPAKRGEILANDLSPIVSNRIAYMVFANRTKVVEPPGDVAARVSDILIKYSPTVGTESAKQNEQYKATNVNRMTTLLTNKSLYWVELARRVDEIPAKEIESLKISGLELGSQPVRYYPEASMAAHLIGFVGFDENGDQKGYFGLEGQYERELTGRDGMKRIERDALGQPIALSEKTERVAEDGRTLVTSIDKTVQRFVEEILKNGVGLWGAISGSVVVVEPVSGKIIAMATFPTYDSANYSYYPTKMYKNPVISDLYEPGSIMKPLIMAAAINEGKLTPESVCDRCSGPRDVGGGVVRTFNNQYHPNTTMTEVLQNSDNTGMVFVGESLGKNLLLQYLGKYEFNQKTGIDLEEEEAGKIKTEWYPLDLATATFGQGIAVTQMEMVRAFSALANGGYLVTPQVVSKIIEKDREVTIPVGQKKRVLSEQTAKTVTEMLISVTEKSPLSFPRSRTSLVSQYKIAAKSGTAQIPIAGSYEGNKTTASVIGYAPAYNPKFLVLVKLDEPSVRPWGSDTAGPIFFEIMKNLFIHYKIAPQ